MNFVFISPNFPEIYSHFIRNLKENGVNVLGIGDQPFESLNNELKENLTEYCYVQDMNNIDWMIKTVQYLKGKYGDIDFLESNNEYWMHNDARLREWFGIKNGYRVKDLDEYQAKSKMKKYFNEVGLKTARYTMVSTFENSINFVKTVGYPVFAKPDSGVGAAGTFKISNEEELKNFHNIKLNEEYIMEEFLDGSIVTFDGIANKESEIVICFKETFPTPIADVVSKNLDMFYFAQTKMPNSFRKMGEKIIKAFHISQRCFHIELFQLNSDKEGFGKKGEVVALEANLRSPGGETPELLNLVSKVDYYKAYADMITNNISAIDNETNLISFSINRKNGKNYAYSSEQIMEMYKDNLKRHGYYPESFRDALGDEFFLFLFEDNKEIIDEFLKIVQKVY